MIAKLIVHGSDRDEAIAQMREALNGFVIRGISQQHRVPVGAAGAPAVRRRRLQHRLHRRALRAAASAPRTCRTTIPRSWSRWRRPCIRKYARARRRHQRPAAGPRACSIGERLRGRRARRRRRARAPRRSRVRTRRRRVDVDVGRRHGAIAIRDRLAASATSLRQRHAATARRSPRRSSARGARWLSASRTTARRSTRWCCSPRAAELLQLMPLQGAARPAQVPAVADAGPAGRRRGAAGPGGAGRRAARRDRGDEDGEHPDRQRRRRGRARCWPNARARASRSTNRSWRSQ